MLGSSCLLPGLSFDRWRSAARRALVSATSLGLLAATLSSVCFAQSNLGSGIGSGLGNVGSGFNSGTSIGWGADIGGTGFTRGDTGNGDPGTGFSFTGGGPNGRFRIAGGQGNTRGLGATTSSVTVMDGHSGYFAAGTLRPFVMDTIPIVGDQPNVRSVVPLLPTVTGSGRSVLEERLSRLRDTGQTLGESSELRGFDRALQLQEAASTNIKDEPSAARRETTVAASNSSASTTVDSLADIRRQKNAAAAANVVKAQQHYQLGVDAQQRGDAAVARYHLKIAEKYADPPLRPQVAARLAELPRK